MATLQEELLVADFSAASTIEELYNAGGQAGAAFIKTLRTQNASFKKREFELDAVETRANFIAQFRALDDAQQQKAYALMAPEDKKVIDQDYDEFMAKQTETLTRSQDDIDAGRTLGDVNATEIAADDAAAIQAEQDRIAAEAAAAGVTPTVTRGTVEILYDGVEKLGEGSYKLTVDPEDGTPPEIFYGASQADCFKALRKSKAHATKELRRRSAKVKITEDMKAMQVEKLTYPDLVAPLVLTAGEIFDLTERRKQAEKELGDPSKVLKATKDLREINHKFYLGSLTQEDCNRINEPVQQRIYDNSKNIGIQWLNSNPEFYADPDGSNISRITELMGNLGWSVTINNLDKAFEILQQQSALLEQPEEQATSPLPVQPASVVPVTPVAVTPPPAAAPATPARTPQASALPAENRVLRPGSSSTSGMPSRRIENVGGPAKPPALTAEEYNRMPAAEVKTRYQREPVFKAAVDALMAAGKI